MYSFAFLFLSFIFWAFLLMFFSLSFFPFRRHLYNALSFSYFLNFLEEQNLEVICLDFRIFSIPQRSESHFIFIHRRQHLFFCCNLRRMNWKKKYSPSWWTKSINIFVEICKDYPFKMAISHTLRNKTTIKSLLLLLISRWIWREVAFIKNQVTTSRLNTPGPFSVFF